MLDFYVWTTMFSANTQAYTVSAQHRHHVLVSTTLQMLSAVAVSILSFPWIVRGRRASVITDRKSQTTGQQPTPKMIDLRRHREPYCAPAAPKPRKYLLQVIGSFFGMPKLITRGNHAQRTYHTGEKASLILSPPWTLSLTTSQAKRFVGTARHGRQ